MRFTLPISWNVISSLKTGQCFGQPLPVCLGTHARTRRGGLCRSVLTATLTVLVQAFKSKSFRITCQIFLGQIQHTAIPASWIPRALLKGFPYTAIHWDACATLILSPSPHKCNLYFQSNYTRCEVTWAVLCLYNSHCTLATVFLYATSVTEILFLWKRMQCATLTEKGHNFSRAFKGPFRLCLGVN